MAIHLVTTAGTGAAISVRALRTVITAAVVLGLVAACSNLPTPRYGVREGRLGDCMGEPGCVSSQALEDGKKIEPFYYSVSRQEARAILMAILDDMPRVTVVSSHRNYIRVEFRNVSDAGSGDAPGNYESEAAIDDIEFYLQPGRKVIHVRAAPRLGSPESGNNRERIQELNRRFHVLHNRHKGG